LFDPDNALLNRLTEEALYQRLESLGVAMFLGKALFVGLVPRPEVQEFALFDGAATKMDEWAVLLGLKTGKFLQFEEGYAFAGYSMVRAKRPGHHHAQAAHACGPWARKGPAHGKVCTCWAIN
jgi:hypothetical protein